MVAGVVGGLLGLGGGFIMGPLFLELGVPPQVSFGNIIMLQRTTLFCVGKTGLWRLVHILCVLLLNVFFFFLQIGFKCNGHLCHDVLIINVCC